MKGNLTPLGKRLRVYRIDHSMTLTEFAKRIGVSVSLLSAIERGIRDVPEGFVERVMAALGMPDSYRSQLENAADESALRATLRSADLDPAMRRLGARLERNWQKMPRQARMDIDAVLDHWKLF